MENVSIKLKAELHNLKRYFKMFKANIDKNIRIHFLKDYMWSITLYGYES